MTVASMTGFARTEGQADALSWVWELKSVNSKSLDLRFRLPTGFEAIELKLRALLGESIKRGAIAANLNVTRSATGGALRVNRAALAEVIAIVKELGREFDVAPPRLDGLLGIKGVIESGEDAPADAATTEHRQAAMVKSFETALKQLTAMRLAEGKRLLPALSARLDEIAALVAQAEKSAAAQPEAAKARLKEMIAALLEGVPALPEDRLAQESALIVARGDIREELDRLTAHIDAARGLLKEGTAVGRRLDFLCQELNREANTLGSKAGDLDLTRVSLGLKAVIEQFREQVQNIE